MLTKQCKMHKDDFLEFMNCFTVSKGHSAGLDGREVAGVHCDISSGAEVLLLT